jgi:hypothetical protein
VRKGSKKLKPLDSEEIAQVLLSESMDQTNHLHRLENALGEENYGEVAEIMEQLENSFGGSTRRTITVAPRPPRRT